MTERILFQLLNEIMKLCIKAIKMCPNEFSTNTRTVHEWEKFLKTSKVPTGIILSRLTKFGNNKNNFSFHNNYKDLLNFTF